MIKAIVKSQTLQTVPVVDIIRYLGVWYEIASYPQRFQKGCDCTTAEYTLSETGYVIVENRCIVNGRLLYIKGKAFVEKNSGNAKLKTQFLWPFKGKYWIIDLAYDYSYAAVSHPDKKYLWILSRTPKINDTIYQQIISRLKEKGFDVAKLKITRQTSQAKNLILNSIIDKELFDNHAHKAKLSVISTMADKHKMFFR